MTTNLSRHFLLDPDVVFLNHGSYGACPRPVFEAYQNWQRVLERQPVAFLNSHAGWAERMRTAREALAVEIGASPENIAGVTNATTGLNIIIQSLNLKPGDEIVTTDHEYGALEKTWSFVTQRTGAKVVVAKIPLPLTSAETFHAAVTDRITSQTKVLFLSHITSPTALLFPIESLIREARHHGIISIIDGAHTPGHIPLALDALGADFYAGNCHKWLMAPKGSGFIHARPEMQNLLQPLVVSHGWMPEANQPGARGPFGNAPFIDFIEMQGTRDPSAWLAVPSAISFRHANDWWAVAQDCRRLAQETAAHLAELTGLAPLSSPEFSAPQMISMPIPVCDPIEIHNVLLERYNIEIPVLEWNRQHLVRLSCQGYNTKAQMNLLVDALSSLLSLGQKAVPAKR